MHVIWENGWIKLLELAGGNRVKRTVEKSNHYWGLSSRKGAIKKKTYCNSEIGRMVLEVTLIWVCASS